MSADALAARAASLWSDRRLRLPIGFVGFAAVTLVTALIAHPTMFSGFRTYDDEGYMLTALKGFVGHGDLYDHVFSQYGPFYFESWGGLFSLLGIPVTHDSGRTVTMVAWIVAGLGLGLVTWRITGSIFLGLVTQVLTFTALNVLVIEPMHPVGIIALLLAAILAIACFVGERESAYPMALLGAAVAALVLVKINVGFFAVVSVALACAVSYPLLWRRRWPRIGLELLFVAVPVLLMLSKFGEGWARHYAIHVAAGALAVVIALRAREPGERPAADLRWLLGGFVALAVVSCLVILAAGTSPHGLVQGVIAQPLRQSDAFDIPMQLSRRLYAFDFVAVAAALAYWYGATRHRGAPSQPWLGFWSLFSIAAGIVIALSVNGQVLPFNDSSLTGYQLSMVPFAWVALVVTVPGAAPRPSFARLLLPLLAALQALHGFPVAGSQTYLSVVLLTPVGALCVANGVRGLGRLTAVGTDRVALAGLGLVVAVVIAWFVGNIYLREQLKTVRGAYDAGYSLGLPGANDIRLGSEEEVTLYRDVSEAIRQDCPATLMEPGMDSFYLWSGQEPPSLTATGWETLFDQAHQDQVIEETSSIKGLCLLRNKALLAGWGETEGPLVTYLEEGFEPLGKWGEYELLQRPGTAPSQP
ncbi:MAG TPA: hypothetical protein VGG40_10335 [Solirubrobacterales bacterium]